MTLSKKRTFTFFSMIVPNVSNSSVLYDLFKNTIHCQLKNLHQNNNKQNTKNSCFRQETRNSKRNHRKWNKKDFNRVICGADMRSEL